MISRHAIVTIIRAAYLDLGFEFLIVNVNGIFVVVLGSSPQQAVSHLDVQQVVQHLDLGLDSDVCIFKHLIQQCEG